ncbi:MAG: cobyrinate a,c-diamide synthase [Gammaproteobacteria bacterium]|nr:cobyrinate a,c-diamide synthase [Gammaproteobacteria bacterium]
MSATQSCPALFISAPASGQGKTTVTAALACRQRQLGRRVRVFKTGPDFLDPMILERASGNPVYQLDLWMGGENHCRQLLYEAAGAADLILIEGVMGLFDGQPSSADLAALFGIPVLAVIDASAMAQTFGAVAFGLARFRDDVPVAGVFANRVGSERHAAMLAPSLPQGLRVMGWLARDADIALPDRHLGLVQTAEVADLDARLARAAASLQWADDALPTPVVFTPGTKTTLPRLLEDVRIAVAQDTAFSFLYRANLDTLRALGAELCFFSPLVDAALPEADGLYLPGGYPELHLSTLQNNRAMREAIRAHHARGKSTLAECGGMLYLLESLTDTDDRRADMLGLLPGHAVMQTRLAALALQRVDLPEGELRGHTFHHSRLETPLTPIARGICPNGGKTAEAVFRTGHLTASYVHSYFPSNPETTARLFLQ